MNVIFLCNTQLIPYGCSVFKFFSNYSLNTIIITNNIVVFLTLFRLLGGGAFDATQDFKNSLLLMNDASAVFLLRDFSSNLPGNNLVLLGFGS